ncbi:transposase, partial [Yeguia hominis]
MRYSYEYKKKCVELYRQGKWPETPDGVKEKRFHDTVRIWVRTEDACGPEALQHKNQNKVWTAEEKYELVAKVLAGASNTEIATAAGINAGLLYQWVRLLLCQDFVQIKMRQFSAFNLPRAQPACAFFHTLVRTHPAT